MLTGALSDRDNGATVVDVDLTCRESFMLLELMLRARCKAVEDEGIVDLGRGTLWAELTECMDWEEVGREGGLELVLAADGTLDLMSRYLRMVGVRGAVKLLTVMIG